MSEGNFFIFCIYTFVVLQALGYSWLRDLWKTDASEVWHLYVHIAKDTTP